MPNDIYVDCSNLNRTTCAFYESRCYWSASLFDGSAQLDEYGYDTTGSCLSAAEVNWAAEYTKSDSCFYAAHSDAGIVVECYFSYARDACDAMRGYTHVASSDTCVATNTSGDTTLSTLRSQHPGSLVSLNLTRTTIPLSAVFDVSDLSDIIILPALSSEEMLSSNQNVTVCGEGYWGVQCRRCVDGWARAVDTGPCEECFRSDTEKALYALSLIGLVIVYCLIIVLMVASALASAKDDRDSTSILLKILVSWLQVRLVLWVSFSACVCG